MAQVAPAVAIFPWGDVIEEFLDPLGLDVEDFASRMRGGWLFGYVAGLQRAGWRPIVVCASENVRRARRLEHAETGAPIWLTPGRRSGRGITAARPSARAAVQWMRSPLRGFAAILRTEQCRAMLVQDYEHARFDALRLLGAALRLPVFATFQGGDQTLSPLEAQVRRFSLASSAGVIVPAGRERERLRSVYALRQDRIAAIPNPLDVEAWRPACRSEARQALGVAADSFVVVNHGRIDIHRKGLDVLVEAWRQLAWSAGAELVIIGGGQDAARFAPLVQATPNVRWLAEYVTDPASIRRWLSAADAYVTLSRTEGMPVAPLEAAACALPVVASDAHGLPDIFEGGEASGGVLVPRGDPQAAAAALRRLRADPALRQRLGAAARRRVETGYAVDVVGARLAAALERPWRGSPAEPEPPDGEAALCSGEARAGARPWPRKGREQFV